jgi:hypothetical protein
MLHVALALLLALVVQVPGPGAETTGEAPAEEGVAVSQVAVQLDSTGDDPVGSVLTDKLRAALEGSPRFRLTTDNSERRLIIVVQHVDRNCRQRNVSTVYSVIWTHNPGEIYYNRYLTATVGFTPIDGVDRVVTDLMIETESLVERLDLE